MKIPTKSQLKYYKKLIDMEIPRKERKNLIKNFTGIKNFLNLTRSITKLAINDVQDLGLKGKKAANEINNIVDNYDQYCLKKDDDGLNKKLEFFQYKRSNPITSGYGHYI